MSEIRCLDCKHVGVRESELAEEFPKPTRVTYASIQCPRCHQRGSIRRKRGDSSIHKGDFEYVE